MQLLLRTEAGHPQAALARMNQLLAAFAATSGENYLKPRRPRTRWGIAHFDRRFLTGEFAPRKRQWLTVPELAGFLKPPTVKCRASSVVRSGGLVPPAPSDLPVYTGQRDLVPLGAVIYSDGRERIGAARVKDLLFGLQLGKSGHGKTEAALVQCIAMAHAGYGTWFFDPHGEGWVRAKRYLAHAHIASGVWEINLAHSESDQLVASWHPLAMEGRPLSAVKDVVRSVTEGVAAAQDWGDNAPRARTILARSAQALALLNHQAVQAGEPDAQCTLFQLRSWLTDEEWREQLLPKLPHGVRDYSPTTPCQPSPTPSTGSTPHRPYRPPSAARARPTMSARRWIPAGASSSARRDPSPTRSSLACSSTICIALACPARTLPATSAGRSGPGATSSPPSTPPVRASSLPSPSSCASTRSASSA